jgi:hypothetical protein
MALRIAAFALVTMTGCRAIFGLEPPAHQEPVDADSDGALADTAIDACPSMSSVFSTCGVVQSGDVSVLADVTYDTDTRMIVPDVGVVVPSYELMTPTGVIVVIAYSSLTIPQGNTLRVVGSKPFGIVASSVKIDGVLDIGASTASHRRCPTRSRVRAAPAAPAVVAAADSQHRVARAAMATTTAPFAPEVQAASRSSDRLGRLEDATEETAAKRRGSAATRAMAAAPS